MGRTIYVEQGIREYIKELAQKHKFIFGVLIGQHSESKDFVVHVAPTTPPAEKSNEEKESDVKETVKITDLNVKDDYIFDHSRQITFLLPGGLCVVGLFVISSSDPLYGSSSHKLQKFAKGIYNGTRNHKYAFGNSTHSKKIVLHINPTNWKFNCKTLDCSVEGNTFQPADWKFQESPMQWQQLQCSYALDVFVPPLNKTVEHPLEKHMQASLVSVQEQLKHAEFIINGAFRSNEEFLDGEQERKKKTIQQMQIKSHSIQILLQDTPITPNRDQDENSNQWELLPGGAFLQFDGNMHILAYVHQRATVGEGIEAVKEDILRTLAARLETHCDSLIDEEQQATLKDSHVLHEPPRRLLIPLPCSPLLVSDYLFPGEGPQEALPSVIELLGDYNLSERDFDDVETHSDEAKTPSEAEMLVDALTDNRFLRATAEGNGMTLAFILLAILVCAIGAFLSYLAIKL